MIFTPTLKTAATTKNMYHTQILIPIYTQTSQECILCFYLCVHMTPVNGDNPPCTCLQKIMGLNWENCLYPDMLRAEYLKSVWHTKLHFLKTTEVGPKDQKTKKTTRNLKG